MRYRGKYQAKYMLRYVTIRNEDSYFILIKGKFLSILNFGAPNKPHKIQSKTKTQEYY